MTNENMTAKSHFAAALVELKAGRDTYAMSHLRESLDRKCDTATRVQILTTAAELAVTRFQQLSNTTTYLLEAQSLLAADGDLPAIHRAHVATLTALLHTKNKRHGDAGASLGEAITLYREQGDEPHAVNAEILLAACLLESGDAPAALALCREVRVNPALDGRPATENQTALPSRLLELNVLQAKVAAAMGKHTDMRRLMTNAIEGLRTRLGDSDFRTLAELAKVADVDFSWMLNDAAHAEVHPFPTSSQVVGEV